LLADHRGGARGTSRIENADAALPPRRSPRRLARRNVARQAVPNCADNWEQREHVPMTGPTPTAGNAQSGSFIVEAALATVLLAVSLFAVASTMSSSLATTARSKQINHGARFLEAVLASLEEQELDALLAMSGNVFHDRATPALASNRVELTTNRIGVDRVELLLVLREQRSGHETARIATVRSRR
jgi:hypothetical protein